MLKKLVGNSPVDLPPLSVQCPYFHASPPPPEPTPPLPPSPSPSPSPSPPPPPPTCSAPSGLCCWPTDWVTTTNYSSVPPNFGCIYSSSNPPDFTTCTSCLGCQGSCVRSQYYISVTTTVTQNTAWSGVGSTRRTDYKFYGYGTSGQYSTTYYNYIYSNTCLLNNANFDSCQQNTWP